MDEPFILPAAFPHLDAQDKKALRLYSHAIRSALDVLVQHLAEGSFDQATGYWEPKPFLDVKCDSLHSALARWSHLKTLRLGSMKAIEAALGRPMLDLESLIIRLVRGTSGEHNQAAQ